MSILPPKIGDRPIRGAMLGTGSIAVHHMRAWQAISGVEIVALANRTKSKAVALGSEFRIDGSHIYDDYRDLLRREDVDFVDIATAPDVHREQVLAAAEAELHVICQKPFAPTVAQATEMIEACERVGVHCIVNENWRWRSWYRDIKEMIAQGVVGSPRYCRLYHHNDAVLARLDGTTPPLIARQPYVANMPRLLVYEVGIHYIDVMRFLFGDIKRVFAHTAHQSTLVEGEDLAVVMLEFRNGVFGIIDISWGSYIPEEYRGERGAVDPFVVEGDAGTIELDPRQNDALIITTASGTERRDAHRHLTRSQAYQESYLHAHTDFIRCLRTGEQVENHARDNLKTLLVAMAVYESAERKDWVDVREPPKDFPSTAGADVGPGKSGEETVLRV